MGRELFTYYSSFLNMVYTLLISEKWSSLNIISLKPVNFEKPQKPVDSKIPKSVNSSPKSVALTSQNQ